MTVLPEPVARDKSARGDVPACSLLSIFSNVARMAAQEQSHESLKMRLNTMIWAGCYSRIANPDMQIYHEAPAGSTMRNRVCALLGEKPEQPAG
jgi:hypothetical protein